MTSPARRVMAPADQALTRAVAALGVTIDTDRLAREVAGRSKGVTRDKALPVNRQRAAKPGSKTGTPSRVMAAVAARRARAWELWMSGVDPVTIGRTLTRPVPPSSGGTPEGYDGTLDDEALASRVRVDLHRAQQDRTTDGGRTMTPREWREYLTAYHMRMLAALAPKVLRGEPRAAEVATKVAERIAKLQGADKPQRIEVSSGDPVVAEAVAQIMGIVGPTDVIGTVADDVPVDGPPGLRALPPPPDEATG